MLRAGITEVIVITGPEHMTQITKYLDSVGEKSGCKFFYKVQETAGGIAQALGLAEEFAKGERVCAILGDNIFFDDLAPQIKAFTEGAHIFLKKVPDPERFGIAELHVDGSVISLEEKPKEPKSHLAVTGCYLYDSNCFQMIHSLKPSARGELEITDLSKAYLEKHQIEATILEQEWIDAGTFESLFQAAALVREKKQ
jgi:glucose-1-phosphate thymidylyltransferase